jgi:hypothetical protein
MSAIGWFQPTPNTVSRASSATGIVAPSAESGAFRDQARSLFDGIADSFIVDFWCMGLT